MTWSDKNVLVTGGKGFIGSQLVKRLLDLGSVVSVADDFSRGKRKNIEPFLDEIKLYTVDLTKLENCLKATKDINYVFHLAARVQKPKSTWRNNSLRQPHRQLPPNCRKSRSKSGPPQRKRLLQRVPNRIIGNKREIHSYGRRRQHINCLFLERNNMINTMLPKNEL